jgi:hypothetical protein
MASANDRGCGRHHDPSHEREKTPAHADPRINRITLRAQAGAYIKGKGLPDVEPLPVVIKPLPL